MAVLAPLQMLVLLVATVYGCMLVFVFLYQNNLLYLPNIGGRTVDITPKNVGLPYESVTLTTSDNVRLDAWFLPVEDAKGVVLFCHGNAGNISHRLDSLLIFQQLGFSTLIFDYRGYGLSEGRPTEAGTYEDAAAAWQYLVHERSIDPTRIVLFGRSLGAAIAAQLASKEQPGALILESAFTSVPDMAAALYPFLPVRLLSRLHYKTIDYVRQVQCPVLSIHSPDDEIIPFSHGEKIFAAAHPPKTFLQLKGGHNEGFLISGLHYKRGLADFLAEHLSGPGHDDDRSF